MALRFATCSHQGLVRQQGMHYRAASVGPSRILRLRQTAPACSDQPSTCSEPGHGASDARVQNLAVLCGVAAARAHSRLDQGLVQLGSWLKHHRLDQFVFGSQRDYGWEHGSGFIAAMLAVPVLPGGGFSDLFTNRVFLAGFWGWFTAQFLKIFTKRLKKGVWDVRAIVDSGGMPSSHSALCAGITTAIAMQHGMGSSSFALAMAFSSIVMYDAAGVRRHAGKQAEVLNQMIGELLQGHPVSETKLKEVLGHTPLQVCCGAILGIFFGIFFPMPHAAAAAAVMPVS